ncbi:MAG: tetratricopeptide repeat protein [Bacteriovoracaceae bacterium]
MLRSFLLTFFAVGFILYASFIKVDTPKPIIQVSQQERQANYSSEALRTISLGNERLFSSLIWIQTLMESDLEHYKSNDLNSWMYLRFQTITDLDPLFYEAYLWGGQYLSIIKDDERGAERIFHKGLRIFPTDPDLNYHSGFNAYFELGKREEAIKNFETVLSTNKGASQYPALKSLVERMKLKEGTSLQDIFKSIFSFYQNTKSKRMKDKYQSILYALKAEIDLNCLNKRQKNCSRTDFFGAEYIKTFQGFKASRTWRPFKYRGISKQN